LNDKNAIREALWVVAMACIALLLIVELYLSSTTMAAHLETGNGIISNSFWVFVAASLSACALVPYLLRDSKPKDFKIIAIVLTAIAPAAAVIFIALNLWRVTHS